MQFKETPSEQECRDALLSLKYLETFFKKYNDKSFSEKLTEARSIIEKAEKKRREQNTYASFMTTEYLTNMIFAKQKYKESSQAREKDPDPSSSAKKDTKEADIKIVMTQAGVTLEKATAALNKNDWDVVDAIIDLTV